MAFSLSTEKKQSTIKQTAVKIKTKIHNTSSFFKLSLKTNNKALALALGAQKQRTRQLETETVSLLKDVQALSFELAIQRHKNKQIFAVLHEFYNNSLNCMAKAADFISKEEVSGILDTQITEDASQSEKDVNELLPEMRNTACPPKHVEEEQNQETTLKSTESFLTENKSTMSTNVEMPEESAYLNMAVIPPVETFSEVQNMNMCTVTSNNEEENIQEHLQEHAETLHGATESVDKHRKSYVTSRNAKSKKRTCASKKHTEISIDTRKAYEVSSYSSVSSNHDDYFSDLEVQCNEREGLSSSVNFFNEKSFSESEDGSCIATKPQNDRANRGTNVIPSKSKPKKNRKTRASSFSLDLNASFVEESTVHRSTIVDTDAHVTEIKGKNRGTYIIHSRQTSVYGDMLNDAMFPQDVSYGETSANNCTPGDKNYSQDSSSVFAERAQMEQGDSSVLSNRSFRNYPSAYNDENASKLPPIRQPESRNRKTEVKVTVRKKNAAASDKKYSLGKKSSKNRSSTQNILTTESHLVDCYNPQENTSSSTAFPQSTRASQCSGLQDCFRDVPRRQTGNADSINSVDIGLSDDVGTINDFGIHKKGVTSRPQNNEACEINCRKTYVFPSCELLEGNESNQSSEDGLITNEGGEISVSTDERTFNPHRNCANQSTPQKTKDLLFQERPPWEDQDFTCDSICTAHSPSKEISQTLETTEEPGRSSRQQSLGGRAMRNLTNTDWTESAPGRTRRKACPVSYKEPSLNSKMRRGDKFSDVKFLSSPVFKEKRKKQKKK